MCIFYSFFSYDLLKMAQKLLFDGSYLRNGSLYQVNAGITKLNNIKFNKFYKFRFAEYLMIFLN
jgi:hypothetical protein